MKEASNTAGAALAGSNPGARRAVFARRGAAMAGLMLAAQLAWSTPAAPDASPVSTASAAAPSANSNRVRVQLVARDQVALSSEINAKIAALPFREGDAFRTGQTLVSFDCALYEAQLHRAQAEASAARELLQVDQRLARLHSVGELEVRQADAKLKASAAQVAYMQATVRQCAIAAPFDGRVAKRSAEPQEFVQAGKPLLTIVDTGHLELKMIVPSQWLIWLKRGHPLTVQVDEVGKTYPARVERIGARVDPVTQTVDVMAALEDHALELLPGMSGWATFATH